MLKLYDLYTNIFSLECDRACEGCTGDGPDLCDKCAEGYELRDGMCTGIIQKQLQFKHVSIRIFMFSFIIFSLNWL